MAHKAIDIAKWFINQSIDDIEKNGDKNGGDEYMTNLKLQKLLYYSQGCHLALENKPLFDCNIEAWKHGPVVQEVYEYYKHKGKCGIVDRENDLPNFETNEIALLNLIIKTFGKFSAWQLREMTHTESPWLDTYEEQVMNKVIPIEKIKKYFKDNVVKS